MKRFRDGQESQSGTIRRDPARARGRRDDSRGWRRSMAFTGGWCGRRSPARSRRSGRSRPGSSRGSGRSKIRSSRCCKLDLEAPRKQRHTAHRIWTRLRAGTSGAPGRRADGAAIRGAAQAGAGSERPGSVRAAELPLGQEGAGRLVRGRSETGWRALHAAVLRDAEHGVGRRVSPGLHQRDAAGISGSSRTCASLTSVASSEPCATTT